MFLRVLGAMVVADALDRRARRHELAWRVRSAELSARDAAVAAPRAATAPWSAGHRSDQWDRRFPERPF